jgi:hypothetical protein
VIVDIFIVKAVVAGGSRWASATNQQSLESHLLRLTHIHYPLIPTEIRVVENAEVSVRIAPSKKQKMCEKGRYSVEF